MASQADEYMLRCACRGYIASMFGMGLGKDVFHCDTMRVEFHHAIERLLGIKYDSAEEKELNRILHALQLHIKFPIPEHTGYGECTLTKTRLREDFDKLSEFYGDELYAILKGKLKDG